MGKHLRESSFGEVGSNEDQLPFFRQQSMGVGIPLNRAGGLDCHDVALRTAVNMRLGQRRTSKLAWNWRPEHVETVGDQQGLIASEVIPDLPRARAGV